MPFTHPVPDWNAQGAEPPESLRTNGWQINQKPPADYFNWFFYNSAKAIIELQLEAINIDQKGAPDGLATLGADGKVPVSQLNVSAPPDASTTVKGVVQLSNSTTSTSEVLAATPKAVKDAKDGLSAQIGILSDSVVPYGTASGTNAKTISITDGFATLKTGLALSFKNTTANTGAVTLNVNGLGAKPVVKSGGTALSSGNLKAGGVYTVRFDGTSFILQGEGGGGNLQPNQALAGFTFTNDSGEQVGVGDADLIASNIKTGIDIFGVTGTLIPDQITSFIPGTLVEIANKSTEVVTPGDQPYKKIGEIQVKRGGTVRVSFNMSVDHSAWRAYGRVYVNGVAVGSERSTSSVTSSAFTENITVEAGDLVQLYAKGTYTLRTHSFKILIGNTLDYATVIS